MALRKQYELERRNSLVGPAMVCATLANIHRDDKKRRQPFSPDDFLPKLTDGPEETTITHSRPVVKQSPMDMLKHVMSVQTDINRCNAEIAAAHKTVTKPKTSKRKRR